MAIVIRCDECGKEHQALVTPVETKDPVFPFDVELVPNNWIVSPTFRKLTICCSMACAERLTKREGKELNIKAQPFREDLN